MSKQNGIELILWNQVWCKHVARWRWERPRCCTGVRRSVLCDLPVVLKLKKGHHLSLKIHFRRLLTYCLLLKKPQTSADFYKILNFFKINCLLGNARWMQKYPQFERLFWFIERMNSNISFISYKNSMLACD